MPRIKKALQFKFCRAFLIQNQFSRRIVFPSPQSADQADALAEH